MSGVVTLSLRTPLDTLVELDAVRPEALASLSEKAIADLPLWLGGRKVQLGELFDVRGHGAAHLRVEGNLSRVSRLGAGMTAGRIDVIGDVGDDAGMAMTGGVLHVAGNAGDRFCAAAPGASKGMTGGEAVVLGSVGREAGARARRGLVVILGDAGPQAARDIIAGTIVVFGRTGPGAGIGGKRGSVVAIGGIEIPSTYRYACTYEPPYVRLLMTYMSRVYGLKIDADVTTALYRRFCGDMGEPGKGEILQKVAT